MPRGTQSRGKCAFCGHETTKGSMVRHLVKCSQRKAQIEYAEEAAQAPEILHHLRVQDAHGIEFWLDLEVRGSAKLKDIDRYLRTIWLECCGHLSRFSIGGWQGKEIGKGQEVDKVFQPGVEVTHIYDFGTSSVTLIKDVGQRMGVPLTAKPIVLMARNVMPEAICRECGSPATHFCMECLQEEDLPPTLCAEHAATHPHDDYGEPVELLNSPRVGMCGYEGPADPPY